MHRPQKKRFCELSNFQVFYAEIYCNLPKTCAAGITEKELLAAVQYLTIEKPNLWYCGRDSGSNFTSAHRPFPFRKNCCNARDTSRETFARSEGAGTFSKRQRFAVSNDIAPQTATRAACELECCNRR